MDADHLDIYGTAEAVQQAFIDFSGCLKPGGTLLSRKGLEREKDLKGDKHLTYGPAPESPAGSEKPDFGSTDVIIDQGDYLFRVESAHWTLDHVVLSMGGRHNVENATVAIAVAHLLGIPGDKIMEAAAAFRGVKRRFEYIVKRPDRVYIDDYAHHPEELRALITGARELFGKMKCTIIFQPHLFTRTRDFADGFAESLDLADEVLLLPIYPARELPVAGVTSELIAGKMKKAKTTIVDKAAVLSTLDKEKIELLITAGAGDIDTLVEPLKQLLEK
jgi:UDP-N-acetylmuramate--alanine ligase